MTLELKPLHPVFVAEATGLDLTKPISRADACEINAAMNRYGVCKILERQAGQIEL